MQARLCDRTRIVNRQILVAVRILKEKKDGPNRLWKEKAAVHEQIWLLESGRRCVCVRARVCVKGRNKESMLKSRSLI
jgi:hypothetical protein